MRSNLIRLGILGLLIMLCIWQTTQLWLGNVASHNFFVSVNTSDAGATQPKQIWVNNNGLAYKVNGDNQGNGQTLLSELSGVIKKANTS